jgi:amino acid transporter
MSVLTPPSPELLRNDGLFSLVVYSVGDMVGSGIYGTIGKAAGSLGNAVWLAFVVSMVAPAVKGLSYAVLPRDTREQPARHISFTAHSISRFFRTLLA